MSLNVKTAVYHGLRADLALLPSTGQVGVFAWTVDTHEWFVDSGSGIGVGAAWIPASNAVPQGPISNLPVLAIGEQYFATDLHILFIGTSGGNFSTTALPLSGIEANLPTDLPVGILYYATDTNRLFVSTGPGNERVVAAMLFGTVANLPLLDATIFYLAVDTKQLYLGTPTGNILVGPSSGGGTTNAFQTEVDFGSLPVAEASFTVANSSVVPTSKISGSVSYQAPTGKDIDELEMDELDLKFGPGSGQLTIYARGRDGYIADKFILSYVVG